MKSEGLFGGAWRANAKTKWIATGLALAVALGIACADGIGVARGGAEGKTIAASTETRPVIGELLTGERAKGDWTSDAPGVRRKLTVADLSTLR